MHLFYRVRFIAAALLLLLVAGCGAGDGGGIDTGPASTYAGPYNGAFEATTAAGTQAGRVQFDVFSDGRFSGTAVNAGLGESGRVSGSITEANAFEITFIYPSGTYTVRGTVAVDDDLDLSGTLTDISGDTDIQSLALNLNRG